MKTNDQVLSILRAELEKHDEILFAYVFGSFVDQGHFRDVDVGVFYNWGFDWEKEWRDLKLAHELEDKLKIPVDLIVINKAPDHLVHSISNGKIILNRDDDERVNFITASWSRYFDIQVKRRDYLHAVAGGSSTHERS